LKALSICSLPNATEQVSRPYTTVAKFTAVYDKLYPYITFVDTRKKATYHVSNGIWYSPNLACSLFIRACSFDLYLPIIFAFCKILKDLLAFFVLCSLHGVLN